jgi:N-methylhydantoinase A
MEAIVSVLGVDVGGTFTDVVGVGEDGRIAVGKVRSSQNELAPSAWRHMHLGAEVPLASMTHGTTVATNALLERSGGRTVLVTTAGFEDVLWLRRQDRADLYDLDRQHPPPLVGRSDVIGVRERIGATGTVVPLNRREIERVVDEVACHRPDAVAVSLLFSFRDAGHEARLVAALRQAFPDVPVAASHEVLPVFREYERTSTVTAEAYLRPLVSGYLERMGREAVSHGIADLRIMASSGGTLSLVQAVERAASLTLSGPAGGVEGARLVGATLGEPDLLTLDMGGTSADASVVLDGQPLVQTAGAVGGIPLALPHVLIETVGAGGGSVAWADRGGALRVGPRSAGASPGPSCYGLGGTEPTVTDAALVLGWLDPAQPLADELRLQQQLAEDAIGRLARALALSPDRCAEGIVEVATATMVRALRRVSVERGIDPRHLVLVAFGGAGPLFTCRLAEQLGVRRAIVPPHAGALSALGLAAAPARIELAASLHRPAAELETAHLAHAYRDMERDATHALPGATLRRFADCRYPGQGYELTVPADGDGSDIARRFHERHRQRFGHADPWRGVEVVNVRLVADRPGRSLDLVATEHSGAASRPRPYLPDLCAGVVLDGPCMIDAPDCTIRLEPGWVGTVQPSGALVVERT